MRTRTDPTRMLLAAAAAALSSIAAGCGGGAKAPGVARLGTKSATTTASSSARASGLLYASCMRAYGISDFPDSAVSKSGGQTEIHVPAAIKSEPGFASASRACQPDLPPGTASTKPGQNLQTQLQFARCMRSHAITDFPDPMRGGGFNYPGTTNSPQFKAAQNACQISPPHAPPAPTDRDHKPGEIELTYLLVGRNHSAFGAKSFSGIIDGGTGEFQDAHGTFQATGYGAIVTVPLA